MKREKLIITLNILMIFLLFIRVIYSAEGVNKKEELTLFPNQSLEWSGYTQVRYTHWKENTDGFRIRRARFSLKGAILENINYKLQIDTVKSPILLDALIEVKLISHAKLTFGQFKVPFSLENLSSSSDLDTINRSLTVEKLCPGRDIGAQGRDIGLVFKGQFSKIEYALGVFNGSGINKTDSNDQKDAAGRLVFYPFGFLTLGLSYYHGKYSPQSNLPITDRDRTGLEMYFTRGEFSVKGEYVSAKDDKICRYGWYIQGGFFFVPKKIQAVVKYDCFDQDMEIHEDKMSIVTFGLNWLFSDRTKFQVNYEYHKDESNKASNNVILAQFQAGF